MNGKYIIFERPDGLQYPMLFPDHFINHNEVKVNYDKPVAAGKFSLGIGDDGNASISVYGESVSLKLKSNPDDAKFIMKQLGKEYY